MNHALVTTLFSLLCPWLALVRLLQWLASGAIRRRGPVRLVILGVAAIGILAVPVGGFTLAGWIRGIEANFSIPLTALLAVGVWENEFPQKLLDTKEKLTGWAFGFLAGLVLYPLAFGLSNFDPYTWGWSFSPLFIASAVLSALLIWKQNRFGVVLVLAILAYHLRLLESQNYWDYLLDPFYFLASLLVLAVHPLLRARKQAPQPHV